MSEIKITELKKAAKELNEEFGFEIDVKLKKEELCEVIAEIWGATTLDKKDENYVGLDEIEDLSETTQAVLNALKPESDDEQEEEETEEEPETEEKEEEVEEKPKKKKSAKELAKEAKELTKKKEAERKARVAEKKEKKSKGGNKNLKQRTSNPNSANKVIMRAVAENPEISIEELKKLNKKQEKPLSEASVGIFRNDMLKSMAILKELGKLK